MRNVPPFSAPRAVSLRGHTAAACIAAVTAADFACFPLDDLSSYSQGSAGVTGVSSAAPEDSEAAAGGRSQATSSGTGGGTDGEQGLSPDTLIDPGSTTGTGGGAAGSGCGSDCPASDGGSSSSADASPPTEIDAGPDVVPPVVVPPVVVPTCSLGEATGPNGRCYVVIASLSTWEEARAECRTQGDGWDLASIRSRADNDFIESLLTGDAWLGGSDAETEETWVWVSDGQAFWQGEGPQGTPLGGAFSNWFDDEPNGSDTSDCMRLLSDGFWADLECSDERASVCEGPPS